MNSGILPFDKARIAWHVDFLISLIAREIIMAKPEWGNKHTCPSCGAKFYDMLAEAPLTCPKCETSFEPERVLKPRRSRPEDDAPAKKPEAEDDEIETDDDDDLLIDDDDDDSVSVELDDDDDNSDVGIDIVTDKEKEDT